MQRTQSADCVLSMSGGHGRFGSGGGRSGDGAAPSNNELVLMSLDADEEKARQRLQRPESSDHSSVCSQYSYIAASGYVEEVEEGDGGASASSSPRTLTRPPDRSTIVVHGGSRLHGAVASSDAKSVRSILDQRPAIVDAQDGTESTPLFYCKTTAICHALLNAGASVNHKNKDGLTPLHRHAIMGRIAIVCALLEAGADDRLLCNRGRSVLDVTARRLEQLGSRKGKRKLQAILMVLRDPEKKRGRGGRPAGQHVCCTIL